MTNTLVVDYELVETIRVAYAYSIITTVPSVPAGLLTLFISTMIY